MSERKKVIYYQTLDEIFVFQKQDYYEETF